MDIFVLTRISCPIQAKLMRRKTAQTTANAMQNGDTAKVRYETAPKNGTLTNDSAACSNHLKLYLFTCQSHNFQNLSKGINKSFTKVTLAKGE